MFYFPVYSLGAAKDPLNPLFQNLMTPELCATNSIGLFRKRILLGFFSKGPGSSVVNTEKQRLAVVVGSTIKWLYLYLVFIL